MPRLLLYQFRYRSQVTGKWVKARYVAERHEIAARHAEWEIVGSASLTLLLHATKASFASGRTRAAVTS